MERSDFDINIFLDHELGRDLVTATGLTKKKKEPNIKNNPPVIKPPYHNTPSVDEPLKNKPAPRIDKVPGIRGGGRGRFVGITAEKYD